MQTIPSKNRLSVAFVGVAVLALVIGAIAWGVNQRSKPESLEEDPMAQVAAPENGVGGSVTDVVTQPDAAAGTVNQAGAATAEPASAGLQEKASDQTDATPALNTLGAVPATHVVRPDETLYSISMKYYNTSIYAGDIEELNHLEDPNHIVAGQELMLPRPESLKGFGE